MLRCQTQISRKKKSKFVGGGGGCPYHFQIAIFLIKIQNIVGIFFG